MTGIDCVIVPRKEAGGKAISASTVRKALQSGDWAALETLLPQTTLDYFRSEEAEPTGATAHPKRGECRASLRCFRPHRKAASTQNDSDFDSIL